MDTLPDDSMLLFSISPLYDSSFVVKSLASDSYEYELESKVM